VSGERLFPGNGETAVEPLVSAANLLQSPSLLLRHRAHFLLPMQQSLARGQFHRAARWAACEAAVGRKIVLLK
jgi:hypothetical protein